MKFKIKYYDPEKQTGVETECGYFSYIQNELMFKLLTPDYRTFILKVIENDIVLTTSGRFKMIFKGYQFIPNRGGYDLCGVEISPIEEN